jgi:hypothetical protein
MIKDPIADDILANCPILPEGETRGGPQAGARQILIVRKATLYSANYVASINDTTPRSEFTIRCDGGPSPSSEVEVGFIRLVPPDALRAPHYNPTRKWLTLWIDIAGMAQVLAQLQQKHRYLWRGEFSNGHIYGDLHSSD